MTATETHTLEQIEEAQASLERVDGWINSCDAKAGILFAVIGVLLTIMFTGDGVKALYNLATKIFTPKSFCTILYIIFLVLSIITLGYGFWELICTLTANTDIHNRSENMLETNSLIFFGSISSRNAYQTFHDEFTTCDKEAYLNDLLSQLYINSKIADKKYKKYNIGLKCSMGGFFSFIIIFLIGLYLY